MKKHIYIISISILFIFGIFLGYLSSAGRLQTKDNATKITEAPVYKSYKVPILTYHYVEYPTDPNDTIRKSLTVLPSNFEAQVKLLLASNYIFITPNDLYLGLKGKKELPQKSVIITFDDGYGDFYTDAYPIIKKYKIPATVFMSTGLVNRPNYLTYTQVKEILQNGLVEFGSHSWSHKNLTQISDKELDEEIVYGKKYFEDMFGVKLSYFAYPYGAYNQKVEDAIKKAGFTLAMSMEGDKTKVHTLHNLFHLSRMKIGNVINLIPYFP